MKPGVTQVEYLIERDRLNFAGSEANHSPEFSSRHQLHGFDAETRGQDAVKRAGGTAALNMAQDGDAHILLQMRVNGVANQDAHLSGARRGERSAASIAWR